MGVLLGQNLGQIRPNIMKKVKKQALSISFFFIFYMGNYLLKQKVVVLVVQIIEWKFNANIARNSTLEGHLWPNFCQIWDKNGKKLIIFKTFTLVRQS